MRELGPEVVVSRPRVLPLYLFLVLGVVQGLALILWGSKGAVVTLGMGYIYALFRWPHLALIAALVIIFDGLGFVNPDTFFRIPGVFKLKDLIFLSLFLPLVMNIKWQKRATQIFHDYRTLLFPILVILFLTTLQMIRTSLQYDLPLSTCIMAGRHYWYYAFVPLGAIYLDTLQKRKVIYRLFLVVILALASVVILQTIMLTQGGRFFLADNIQMIQPKQWGTLDLFRIYPPGEPILVLGFSIAFWRVFLGKPGRERLVYAIMAMTFMLAILLISSRMRWAHTILVILIPLFILGPYIPKGGRRLISILALFLVILVSVFALLGSSNTFVSGVGAQAFSAWTDFRDKTGTWEGRLEDNRFRFRLIKENPLFGVGFVHVSYSGRFGAEQLENEQGQLLGFGVATTDSGIVALLIDLGSIGALWAIWYFMSVLSFCLKMLRYQNNGDLRWTSMPLISYMTGGVITLVTLCLFTMQAEIVGHSFALGILASDIGNKLQPEK